MKDLILCGTPREDFQRWLGCGFGPLTISQGGKAAVILNSLPKTSEIDYLYSAAAEDGGVTWNSDLRFCGVYDHRGGTLYLTLESLRTSAVKDMVPPIAKDSPAVDAIISAKVNRRVERYIANDRNNLTISEVSSCQALRDLKDCQDYDAWAEAIQHVFGGREPDVQFHSGYALDGLLEEAFIAYVTDPELFIQTETEQYIKNNQEKFLLQFLKNDALLAEYQALMQDTGNPIHRMKAITDAIKGCGAKMVTVTVQKKGQELTFKTAADSLIGHRGCYRISEIPASDRKEFERLFGRYADYNAEDVTRITYGRNTIYEASTVPVEEMGPVMQL